jgi:hypothetical protein
MSLEIQTVDLVEAELELFLRESKEGLGPWGIQLNATTARSEAHRLIGTSALTRFVTFGSTYSLPR